MIFYQQNNDIQVEVRKFIKNERVYNDERSREAERNGERENAESQTISIKYHYDLRT